MQNNVYIMKDLGYKRTPVSDDKKWILISFDDGRFLYKIPTQLVCDNRDEYYHTIEIGRTNCEDTFGIHDDYEIHDWLFNNMNWEDVKDYAISVPTQKEEYDFVRGWSEATSEKLYDGKDEHNSN